MKNLSRKHWLIFAFGILCITGTSFLSKFITIPDAIMGFSIGLGLALSIGILLKHRLKKV